VTAIFKKGSKSEPGNYRPVSLTCIICKVLESVVRDAIVSHFSENNLYTNCQHGFRKKRSCVTQLLHVMEEVTSFLDEGNSVDIIYFDFKKAFDTVPHNRLLTKLAAYGICGNILNWIKNFLSGRTQQVRVGTQKSGKTPVLSGIPQGSILGPILFTVFINDLPNQINSMCDIFADDTKIYNITKNNNIIQSDIFKLQEWTEKWNLYFNVSKCNVMHIGKRNAGCEYVMKVDDELQKINVCENEKDLGITFDSDFSFDIHIQRVVAKANQMLGIIKRSFTFLDKEVFLYLYKALVRPHLEYGNVIWNPYLKRQSIQIEKVQRRATKLLKECQQMTYTERLLYLNLHSLKGRRLRGDLIQTFKIFNQVVDVDVSSLFSLSLTDNTRNSQGKIFTKHCNINKRKFSFSFRITNHWNALTAEVKFAPSTNHFKNLLDSIPKFVDLFYDFD